MKVGVYTKALEELTPRPVRDADPDRAIEDWVEFAIRNDPRLSEPQKDSLLATYASYVGGPSAT